MKEDNKLKIALFSLRIGVFIVFFMWGLDKLVNPDHAAAVFSKYYKIDGLGVTTSYVIGGLQMLLLAAFVFGFWKNLTYSFLLVFHAISTVSTLPKLLTPWENLNLLFYAAIPMLAALFVLWLFRNEDTLMNKKS